MPNVKTLLTPVARTIATTQAQVQSLSLGIAAQFEDPLASHHLRTQALIAQQREHGSWTKSESAKKMNNMQPPKGKY